MATGVKRWWRIRPEDLVETAMAKGKYFVDGLNSLSKHKSFHSVRGLGLMQCLQLTTDAFPELSADERKTFGASVSKRIKDNGLIVGGSLNGGFKLLPPFVVEYSELDRAVSILDESIGEAENELRK